MRQIVPSVAFVIALPVLVAAQSALTGKWQGQTPSGEPVTLDMIVKGESLTGTMNVNDNKAPIEKGKVSKATFTFSVTMDGGPQSFAGEGAADEIKIWMEERGPSRGIVLKRAKTPK